VQVLAVPQVRDGEALLEERVVQARDLGPLVVGVAEGGADVGRDGQAEPGLEALRERAVVRLAAVGADAVRARAEDQRRQLARLLARGPVGQRTPVVVERIPLDAGLEARREAVVQRETLARALGLDVVDGAEREDPARLVGGVTDPTDRQAFARSLRSSRHEADELGLVGLRGSGFLEEERYEGEQREQHGLDAIGRRARGL